MLKTIVLVSALTAVFGNVLRDSIDLDGRIIGGKETTIEEFPYQVSIRVFNSHVCGGAIIDETSVITAAQCVVSPTNPESYLVLAGSTDVKGPGQLVGIEKITIHEKYNNVTSDYNVAVLKLKQALTFDNKVQPVQLQDQDVPVIPASIAKISGWGSLHENDYPVVPKLHMVEVDTISNAKCQRYYLNRYQIEESMMCSNNDGYDACGGDFGGPLVSWGKLVGLITWSIGCGIQGNPRTYTNISVVHDWIIEHKA